MNDALKELIGRLPIWLIAIALLIVAVAFAAVMVVRPEQIQFANLLFGVPPKPVVLVGNVPEGAVVAFDRGTSESPCPDKWERFVPADGRVILGAGGKADDVVRAYQPLKSGDATSIGGSETLRIPVSIKLPQGPWFGSDLDHGNTPWSGGPNPVVGDSTASTEVSADNRQPYVALMYCLKL